MSITAVLARGGASRGLVIHARDLAHLSQEQRDRAFARWLGSPDATGRQIDGVGGGNGSTSKIAVVGASASPDHDVDCRYFQIGVATGRVDDRSTCGNMSVAVGQFAVAEGLVRAIAPTTTVRIRSLNTSQTILVEVPVCDGRVVYDGPLVLPGVPGSGAPVVTRFRDPAGSATGMLLPTGHMRDEVRVGQDLVSATLIDVVGPAVFVRLPVALQGGRWAPEAIEADTGLMQQLDAIRRWAAVQCRLAVTVESAAMESPLAPLVGIMGNSADGAADASVRVLSAGNVHRALPLGAGLAAAAIVQLDRQSSGQVPPRADTVVRLAHPSGLLEARVFTVTLAGATIIEEIAATLTGRRIFTGELAEPDEFSNNKDAF